MLTVPERVAVRRDAERAAANVAELLRAAAGSLDSILDGRVGRKGCHALCDDSLRVDTEPSFLSESYSVHFGVKTRSPFIAFT